LNLLLLIIYLTSFEKTTRVNEWLLRIQTFKNFIYEPSVFFNIINPFISGHNKFPNRVTSLLIYKNTFRCDDLLNYFFMNHGLPENVLLVKIRCWWMFHIISLILGILTFYSNIWTPPLTHHIRSYLDSMVKNMVTAIITVFA